MTARGELDRLDQLGKEAAQSARLSNHALNHASSNIAAHATMSVWKNSPPVIGRLAVCLALFMIIAATLQAAEIPYAVELAGGVVVALEFGWWRLKKQRAANLRDQAISLNAQLDDLKEQDFALRYEQAKANGDLDRFGNKEEP